MKLSAPKREIALSLTNLLLYALGFYIAVSLVSPDGSLDLDSEPNLLRAAVVMWFGIGALTGLWSRFLVGSLAPSFVAIFLLLGFINFAVALAFGFDMSTPSFWSALFGLDNTERLAVVAAAVSSAAGWWIVRFYLKPKLFRLSSAK